MNSTSLGCCAQISGLCTDDSALVQGLHGRNRLRARVRRTGCCRTSPQPCALMNTRRACERTIALHSAVARGPAGGDVCVWLGGKCVEGQQEDCREPWRFGQSDYYGEERGFESLCDTIDDKCDHFPRHLAEYARRHAVALTQSEPVEGTRAARILLVRDQWINVGMGFIPGHVGNLLHFVMMTGIHIYFENYGKYDWQKYFYGYGGLDTRWTKAKHRLWAARFATAGIASPTRIDVYQEYLQTGDEDWEEHLAAALSNSSIRWILIEGQATTINWNRVLKPALEPAVAVRLRAAPLLPLLPMTATPWVCGGCGLWAMFRPRRVLRERLKPSPVGRHAPLACFKARTLYAEDKAFFPDDLPEGLEAADRLWLNYNARMGDNGLVWGPRPRLRCDARIGASAALHKQVVIPPSVAVRCMQKVRAELSPAARVFVAVDAPRLQQILFSSLGDKAFITPGVGIDPTNEFRDSRERRSGSHARLTKLTIRAFAPDETPMHV
uniref:Uncharacterized protein n=1 Tax=Chrysotila carterae TaxID=13221 RepID=A0A7S4F3G6_CHRCT